MSSSSKQWHGQVEANLHRGAIVLELVLGDQELLHVQRDSEGTKVMALHLRKEHRQMLPGIVAQVSRMAGVTPWLRDLLVRLHERYVGVTKLHSDGLVPCVQYWPFQERF
jgi:hypothetical protein